MESTFLGFGVQVFQTRGSFRGCLLGFIVLGVCMQGFHSFGKMHVLLVFFPKP